MSESQSKAQLELKELFDVLIEYLGEQDDADATNLILLIGHYRATHKG